MVVRYHKVPGASEYANQDAYSILAVKLSHSRVPANVTASTTEPVPDTVDDPTDGAGTASAQRPEVSLVMAPSKASAAAAVLAGAPEVSAAKLAEVGEEEEALRVKRQQLAKKLADEAYKQEAVSALQGKGHGSSDADAGLVNEYDEQW